VQSMRPVQSCETPFMQITQAGRLGRGEKARPRRRGASEHRIEFQQTIHWTSRAEYCEVCFGRTGYRASGRGFLKSVRCRPRNNATPSMRQVRACQPFVLRALEVLRPRSVLALGATALRSVTNDGHGATSRPAWARTGRARLAARRTRVWSPAPRAGHVPPGRNPLRLNWLAERTKRI